MPRPRPPRLQREITRHGRAVWYVRRNHGKRVRLQAQYGTPEFEAEYQAAVAVVPIERGKRALSLDKPGTLKWLWERYRETSEWSGLALSTRRQRENIMRPVLEQAGGEEARRITRADILDGRDRRKATPGQAIHFVDAMRALFRWALDAQHVTGDPTVGVKHPKQSKERGIPAWTEDEVERFEARWPIGSRQRVWLAVLLYTGLRRSDAVVIGRQHVRNGVATIVTKKTKTSVVIPILPVLQAILDAGPTGDLSFICGKRGAPLTEGSFSNMFQAACEAAGVEKSAHGLRKIGAIRAAHAGATTAELEAIFGWTGGRQAAHYIKEANRARLAKGAMSKLDPGTEDAQNAPSIPAPLVPTSRT